MLAQRRRLLQKCCIFKLRNYSTECSNFTKPLTSHVPVLLETAVSYLNVGPSKLFIDMTFGAGGHSKAILQKSSDVKLYALDRDPIAYENAKELSEKYPGQLIPMLGKFSDLPKLLKQHGVAQKSVDGILFDFGCSSMQFDNADRGFSVHKDGLLDMRMGQSDGGITALELLAKIDEFDLAKIIKVYGQEKSAKKIARAIVEMRSLHKIETTKQLADLIISCTASKAELNKPQRPMHTVIKTFQALRIFINNELNEINYGIVLAERYLKNDGRLVTITFHSLEDTIVKRHINGNIIEGAANPLPLKYTSHGSTYDQDVMESVIRTNWKQLHKHVIVPDEKEIRANPRSRSAKLRAAAKIS